jgi:hypothetical protein
MKVDIRQWSTSKRIFSLSIFITTFLLSAQLISAHFTELFQLNAGQQSTIKCLGNRLTTERKNSKEVLVKCAGAVASPTPSASPQQSSSPTPSASPVPSGTPVSSGDIFGAVLPETLGTCPASVHDRFVTKGPDGKNYRTWHPQTVPLDPNNPSGPSCTFGHEHGADPASSPLFTEAIPFGYVGSLAGMDEPHAGFKCFVANKGTTNDEGRVATNDSMFCFHMGTGGPSRFTQRFHSMVYKLKTGDGKSINVQGMADTGSVGSICSSPRAGKTVLSLGCQVGSAYEIWENVLKINNKGQTVATAIASTAVFDPITVRDPQNESRVILTSSADANPIFKFNDSRADFRGCKRESYFGPVYWYNDTPTTTYYTDAFGNVTANGPLKQEISQHNTTKFVASSDGQTVFKLLKDSCGSGLSLKN